MDTKLLLGIAGAAVMVGCASTPQPNIALESARAVVRSAEADPNVARYAALDLAYAKKELQLAEAAALHNDEAAVANPAYLAAGPALLAQLKATAGFTDCVGSDAFNRDLSQRHADAVRFAVQARGIDPTRITTRGYGEELPVAK